MTGGPRSARRRPAGPRARLNGSLAAAPFAALGLEASADVTDDDVRAAWRRVAAATHPDRADGGDPEQFAAAAAAYTSLRTRFGRGEALADLRAGSPRPTSPGAAGRRLARAAAAVRRPARAGPSGAARRMAFRVRRGRPWRLALRVLTASCASAAAVAAAGPLPAAPALITGAVTWLVLTARHDLAPPAPGQSRAAPAGDHRSGLSAGS